jgi:hypothetical protein
MRTLAACALLSLAACGVQDLSGITPELTEADSKSTHMVFALRNYLRHADGRQTFSLCASDAAEPVGFDLELGTWTENGPGFIDITTFECRGRLVSQGAASDAWLRSLDRLYGTGRRPTEMAKEVEIQAVTLHAAPDFEAGRVMLTLVLPPTMEAVEDPQVQLVLDLPAGRATLRELHRQLRRAVVAALEARADYAIR